MFGRALAETSPAVYGQRPYISIDRQLIIVCKQTNVDSGNSGTVCILGLGPGRGQAAEITADSNQRQETKQAKLLPSLLPSLEGITLSFGQCADGPRRRQATRPAIGEFLQAWNESPKPSNGLPTVAPANLYLTSV
jgi:hypothetical protein